MIQNLLTSRLSQSLLSSLAPAAPVKTPIQEKTALSSAVRLFPGIPTGTSSFSSPIEILRKPSVPISILTGISPRNPIEVVNKPPFSLGRILINANAQSAGLSDSEIQRLDKYLDGLQGQDLSRETKLVSAALSSANPDRAARTYLDMIYARGSGRVTPDIVASLVMGVGNSRTSAAEGKEGILGQNAATRAATTLTTMPQADYDQISSALKNAGSETERALILKSVSAREKAYESGGAATVTQEIVNFANQIRGRDSATLIRQTTFVDLDGDSANEGLMQRWNNSCVPTTAQIMRAENDPIWALQYYNEIGSTSNSDDLGSQEASILRNAGKTPVARDPKNPGGDGMLTPDAVNNLVTPATDVTYKMHNYSDSASQRNQAMYDMERYLQIGVDVPIGVGWNNGGGHVMLATDVRGTGDNREFLISDPWTGHTGWISSKDIANGNTDFFAGTGKLREIELPG